MSGWPTGTRLILRKERPHPGAQLRFTDSDGLRVTAFIMQEARQFIEQAPHYLQQAQDHSSVIGRLNERFHVQQRITDMIHGSGAPGVGGLVKAGETVFGAVSHVGVVVVLTVYFLADMRRIRATMYPVCAEFTPTARDPDRRRGDGQVRGLRVR
jgi:hypothetical protein